MTGANIIFTKVLMNPLVRTVMMIFKVKVSSCRKLQVSDREFILQSVSDDEESVDSSSDSGVGAASRGTAMQRGSRDQ